MMISERDKASRPFTFFVFLIIISLLISATDALANQEEYFSSGGSIAPADLEGFIDQVMAREMDRYHLPGAAIAVVQNGQTLLAKGYGIADVDKGFSVDAQKTIFPIASVTKLFTWTLVMQMVEQGKLDLKADINNYLVGDFQIPAIYPQPIALLDLMSHTPGFEDNWIGILSHTADGVDSLRQYLTDHMPRRVRPPGVITGYSNYGVALAGYIAAKRCGSPYEECIRTYILEPLQMERTYVILEGILLLYGVPPVARLVFTVPYIVILLTIATMIMMVLAWKNNYWNTWGRVHYSLVALALCFYTWFAWFWNLAGFDIFG